MNKTKIEWADYTWNPVTGCLHGCPYCYARAVANRFGMEYAPRLGDPGMEGACKYDSEEGMDTMLELVKPYERDGRRQPYPMGFLPTFHRYKLDEPARKTKGAVIFVGSMTDLFGDWVPEEWIEAVFAACRKAPQHTYLFLTKNWMRACKFRYEPNWWVGRTYTHTEDALAPGASNDNNLYLCYGIPKTDKPHTGHENRFLSIEPLKGAVTDLAYYAHEYGYKWVIVGAETGNRSGKIVPKREWIDRIVADCDLRGVPVFMKDSLKGITPEMLQQTPPQIVLTTKGARP